MVSALLYAGVLAALPLDAAERDAAVVAVVTPQGAATRVGASTAIRALSRVLLAESGLDPRSPEQAGLDAEGWSRCPKDQVFSCWTRALRRPGRGTPRWLLVVSLLPLGKDRDRLVLMLLDLEQAAQLLERTPGAAEAEDALFAATARSHPTELAGADEAALEQAFTAALPGPLEDALERAGRYRPHGSLQLRADCTGCLVWLEGRALGPFQDGGEVRGLLPGGRRLELRDEGGPRCGGEAQVTRGKRTTLSLACASPTHWPKDQLRWSGVGAASAGVGLLVLGAALAASGPATLCIGGAGQEERCGGLGVATTGAGQTPTLDLDRARPGGVALLPLGLALGTAGATFIAGSALGDEGSFWWFVAGGLLAGGTVYAAGAVLGSPR